MELSAFAQAVSAQAAQKVQSEVSVKVFRMALDSQATTASALLDASNVGAGLGQNLNLLG